MALRTPLDISTILYKHLSGVSEVVSAVTGIYRNRRPPGSKGYDVVINALPVDAEQVQQAVANVNIHVPNMSQTANGVTDNAVPNLKKLSELLSVIVPYLTEQWPSNQDYHFTIQQVSDPIPDGDNHFINIRVDFINLNF